MTYASRRLSVGHNSQAATTWKNFIFPFAGKSRTTTGRAACSKGTGQYIEYGSCIFFNPTTSANHFVIIYSGCGMGRGVSRVRYLGWDTMKVGYPSVLLEWGTRPTIARVFKPIHFRKLSSEWEFDQEKWLANR